MRISRVNLLNFAKAIEAVSKAGIDAPTIVVDGFRLSLEQGEVSGQFGSETRLFVTLIEPLGGYGDPQ